MNTKCLQQTVMIVLLLLAGCTQGDEGAPSVRTIPIPKREHGYSNFDSTAIASQEALDRFLETGSKAEKMGWNNRVDFDKALAAAGLNFDKEVLVLLRHTEGSGSVQVDFRPPTVEKDKVICRIDRREPEVGTADMAYYCFALAVAKSGITGVELRVSGREAIILPVEAGGLPKKQSVQLKGGFLRWGGKGYDSARLKWSTRFAALVADKADDTAGMLVEIWVDTKETSGDLAQLILASEGGMSTATSIRRWKSHRHVTAPWICVFAAEDIKRLPKRGHIIANDSASNQLLAEKTDFQPIQAMIAAAEIDDAEASPNKPDAGDGK